MSSVMQPSPLWPDGPRYCPERPLPPYRFVPGLSPHPERDPKGHSYGQETPQVDYIPPSDWQRNTLYLFGIDLYHQSYFWEAHEAWEVLWKLSRKQLSSTKFVKSEASSVTRQINIRDTESLVPPTNSECEFLQGLIQNAAAQLKLYLKQWEGVAHLSQEAYRRFQFVETSGECAKALFMGIDVARLICDMERHYGPLWHAEAQQPKRQLASPPRLELANI